MKSNRAHPRLKRRLNCDVSVGGTQYVGVVLDLSPGGFFVQTGALPAVGATVDITLRRGQGPPIELQARVANRRPVPRRLASVARGGLGCSLSSPPESYYQLLGNLSGG